MLICSYKRVLLSCLGVFMTIASCSFSAAQAYAVNACETDFSNNGLGSISHAFRLCAPAPSRVTNSDTNKLIGTYSLNPSTNSSTDIAEVQRNLYVAHELLSRLSTKLLVIAADDNRKNKNTLDWLKLSGFVVGAVGGGLGGGLHLVNNPSVRM